MTTGGAERVASIVANSLCNRYEVFVYTLVFNESSYMLNDSVIYKGAEISLNRKNKFTRLCGMGVNFGRSITNVRKVIGDFKPDYVISFLVEMDIVTFLATRGLSGFKWIVSERNDPTRRKKVVQKLLKYIYQKADILVCQSKMVAEFYDTVRKKTIIPNPIDISGFPEMAGEVVPMRIVSVGRLHKQKNFSMLIEAFAGICERFPQTTVTVYGEGPERGHLQKRIDELGLQDRFLLPGKTTKVWDEIKDAAVFAFPTNHEGFPNVLIEAMAMGLPVVTTDFATGVAREIVNDDVGIVVPCGDCKAFSVALCRLLENDEKRAWIRQHSCKAIEPFLQEKVIKMWETMLDGMGDDT